ncbi:MAG: CheY-specific phosphatase CheX [Planctomycetota bacterium]|jgi:CheY-specific phosphatase CheX
MPNQDNNDLSLPTEGQLLDTLKTSIEDTFAAMLINFRSLAGQESSRDEGLGRTPEMAENPTPSDVEYASTVRFDGALNGAIVLRFTSNGAQDIARGLLMLDDGDTLELEDICDALGECANLVSGALKTKALDPVSQFTMSCPITSGPTATSESADREGSTLAYHLTRGQLTAEVWLK